MSRFGSEARKAFDFLLESAIAAHIPEVAELRLGEATGMVKYPFLEQLITLREYESLIAEIAKIRQERFSTLIQQTVRVKSDER